MIPDRPGYWWQIDPPSENNRPGTPSNKRVVEVAIKWDGIIVRDIAGHSWSVMVNPEYYTWAGPVETPSDTQHYRKHLPQYLK